MWTNKNAFIDIYAVLPILAFVGLTVIVVTIAPRKYNGFRAIPSAIMVIYFLALTHYPLPMAGEDCTSPNASLVPFKYLWDGVARWVHGGFLIPRYSKLMISTTALNFHFCALIGMTLTLWIRQWKFVLLLGVTMTSLVEISQLTGVFGLYNCPWRRFDVDDLILNAAGVVFGFALARIFYART